MSDQRNLILAIVLSVVIILGFQYFYEGPRIRDAQQRAQPDHTTAQVQPSQPAAQAPAGQPATGQAPAATGAAQADLAEANAPRVRLDNGRLHGSVSLLGGRIAQVTLADYHETIDPSSPEITLLSPPGKPNPYFAQFGWVAGDQGAPVPDATTLWQAQGNELTPQSPVNLTWHNGQGLAFGQQIGVDQDYMFSVKQTVTNN